MSRLHDPVSQPYVGTHVRGAGKLANVPARARDMGAECVQVFLGNPRGWALSPGDARSDETFRHAARDYGMPVLVHTPYLVNLGSPTAQTYERSVAVIEHSMHRAEAVGATGVVVHTGSCVSDGSHDDSMAQVRNALLPILERLDEHSPDLLLEPTAGQGRSLCSGIDDIAPYLDAVDWHPKARVCLDTCHLFAAGHDVSGHGAMTAALDRLTHVLGESRLAAVHANDSMDVCGSFRDRHQRIGAGHIGTEPFAELLAHPSVAGRPVVLETPGGPEAHAEDIDVLLRLRSRVA